MNLFVVILGEIERGGVVVISSWPVRKISSRKAKSVLLQKLPTQLIENHN
jgi:hypothetical protein